MTTDSNVYSGDDEGFESSAEKVSYLFYLYNYDVGKVMITGNQSDPTELKTDNDEEESDSSRMTVWNHHHNVSVPDSVQESEKQELLANSAYFRVEVSLLCGRELIAMDRGGTSDPYVLIKQDGDALYRSNEKKKTVNPVWNDQANVCVENPFTPLVYEVTLALIQLLLHLSRQVYDRDVVGSDDFMGSAEFDLTSLEFNKSQEVSLNLEDAGDEDLIRLLGGTN